MGRKYEVTTCDMFLLGLIEDDRKGDASEYLRRMRAMPEGVLGPLTVLGDHVWVKFPMIGIAEHWWRCLNCHDFRGDPGDYPCREVAFGKIDALLKGEPVTVAEWAYG